ncbi:hypothetical protein IF2G_07412 [Cordyceps javanica]|nr:hypothetical protein IF2G_07412 [Cordyceps javanica]
MTADSPFHVDSIVPVRVAHFCCGLMDATPSLGKISTSDLPFLARTIGFLSIVQN